MEPVRFRLLSSKTMYPLCYCSVFIDFSSWVFDVEIVRDDAIEEVLIIYTLLHRIIYVNIKVRVMILIADRYYSATRLLLAWQRCCGDHATTLIDVERHVARY